MQTYLDKPVTSRVYNRDVTIYRYIAIFATAIQYNMTETGYRYIAYCNILQYIVWWAVTSLLVIKFLGDQLVARKQYLMQTLRLALTL